MANCPKCNSASVQFNRENMGELRGKKSKQIIHQTVGLCKDCGFTWTVEEPTPKKRKTWLWVLGWLCIFPVPLTILLLRKKDMKPALKYGIVAVAWIVYLLIGIVGAGSSDSEKQPGEPTEPVVEDARAIEPEKESDLKSKGKEEAPIVEKYDNEIIVAAKITLDKYISDYDMSLAPQRWTLARFDDNGAVMALADCTLKNRNTEQAMFVLTPIFDGDKMTGATPHYVAVGAAVYVDDGYCDEFFANLQSAANVFNGNG